MPRSANPDIRFGYEPDDHLATEQIKGLVVELNRTRIRNRKLPLDEYQEILRGYVNAWIASGPNLRRLFRKNPKLKEASMNGTTILWPGPAGRGYLEWSPNLPEGNFSPETRALKEFITLIANPKWTMLGGPCKRCDDFFLKRTSRNRKYCSRTCGAFVTASSVMKKKRAQQREKVIKRVSESIADWQKTSTGRDWKRWVSSKTGISLSWLTRAVRKGDIHPPARFQGGNAFMRHNSSIRGD